MGRGHGRTLAERSERPEDNEVVGGEPDQHRARSVVTRHCWVSGVRGSPGRCAGLVLRWRPDVAGRRWIALVAYAVDEGGRTALVQEWLPACQLESAL